MKAIVVTAPGELDFVDLPQPKYHQFECLVRVRACGLCNGTDMKMIDGTLGNVQERYPVLLGHEAVGEIVEVGSKVKSFRMGDLITDPVPAVDVDTVSPGCAGFCEYGVVQDLAVMDDMGIDSTAYRPLTRRAALVREDMPPVDAAMLVTFKETLSALRNFGVVTGSDVLIYGDGPNGLSLAFCARHLGASHVAIVGHWDQRLERIQRVARADCVVNSRTADVDEALAGRQFDVVIDAVGSVRVIREGLQRIRTCGKLAVFGVLKNTEPDFGIRDFPNGAALQMLSWPIGANDVHADVVNMVLEGALSPAEFYSHVAPWQKIREAVAAVRSRDAFKYILTL